MPEFKKLTDVRYLVVHCSATPADMDIGAKEIDQWHRQRGFNMIGYHSVIRRNGKREQGRKIDQPGAHALGFNLISLGTCLVGGVKSLPQAEAENNFAPEQFAELRVQLIEWKVLYPNAEIVGHRDLPSQHSRLRECPSFSVKEWLAANPL